MFGGRSASTGASGTGTGLFGNSGQNSGSLFGASSNTAAANSGNSLFGNNTSTGGSGLFGANTNNNVNTSGNATGMNTGATGGALFGNSSGTGTGTSLFGNNGASNTTGGGLFGSKPTASGTTGFGSASSGAGGLFGNTQSSNTGKSGGLFGNSTTTGGLFGNQQQQQPQMGSNMFGGQQGQLQFQQQPQPQQQSSLNFINQLAITPMTKISELPPQVRQEIEQLDQYINTQISLSKHLQADLNDHTELLDSIPRDIKYLQKLHFNATRSLSSDLKKIDSIKTLVDKDVTQLENFSIMLQQLVSKGFKISNVEIDKFFQEKLTAYKYKLNDYNDTLTNIENAVSGLENDMFGNDTTDDDEAKVGTNVIVTVLMEEFKLFMDTAERIAELHQKCKEIVA